MIGRYEIAPCTVKAALALVRAWHRHMPELQGGLFAAACVDGEGRRLGVAVAGNPSRAWQGTGRIVISRVATKGAENACSMLYGALCRAAKALGYREAWTYTLPDEPGTSLRAAGFMDMGLTDGGEWDRPSRRRNAAVKPDRKRRWLRILSAPRSRDTHALGGAGVVAVGCGCGAALHVGEPTCGAFHEADDSFRKTGTRAGPDVG